MTKKITAEHMYGIRLERSKVNHETYKMIYHQITRRIETHGRMGSMHLDAKIPHYVTGRPIYDVMHAARYVAEKLRFAGFSTHVHREDPDEYFVRISWKTPPPPPPPKKTPKAPSSMALPPPGKLLVNPLETTRRIDMLKARLEAVTARPRGRN